MRILSCDSEPEELETASLPSQTTIVADTITSPAVEEVIVVTKRVSVAWLCFDREKKYQKHGIEI